MYSESTWLWTVYTTLANAIRRDWLSCKMISNTTGLKSFPHSHSIHSFYPPSGFPRWPLILIQTTTNITDARHYNPSPSSLIFILFDMHTPSKARIPQVLIIPWHQPFISPLHSYLAKLLAQQKNTTTSQVLPKPPFYTSQSVSHLHSRSILLDLRSYQPTTTFYPLPALVPSTFPHQYSTIPHHHSRCLLLALHNTPTKRKASPCIICNSNGEIPAAKMTANKQKANLKNMLCSH